MDLDLNNLRLQIETLDEEILELLAKRFEIVKRIGVLKKTLNQNPLNQNRWAQVLEKVNKKSLELGLNYTQIELIWENIHSYALQLEQNEIDKSELLSK